jgi:hypothetical protein
MSRSTRRCAVGLLALALLAVPGTARAQGKRSDSVVKVTATADKPGADGKQTVTVTLTVDPKWHVYANPVGLDDLSSAQTTVTLSAKDKLAKVKVDYPAGKLVKDKVAGDYKIYEGKAVIKATVHRARGDTSPLEVAVKLQACNSKTCLLPATIKVKTSH